MVTEGRNILGNEYFWCFQILVFLLGQRDSLVCQVFHRAGVEVHMIQCHFIVVLLRPAEVVHAVLVHLMDIEEHSRVDAVFLRVTDEIAHIDTLVSLQVELVHGDPHENEVEGRNEQEHVAYHVEELLSRVSDSLHRQGHHYHED